VVGTGILPIGHCSAEAKRAIAGADVVFAQAGDDFALHWLRDINGNTISLAPLYHGAPDRTIAYEAMVDAIMAEVRKGLRVCAVFYGHPGVFVTPSSRALTVARGEGFDAWMLPAISAEDCLFADLELDPAVNGCQSFEARDFVLNVRIFDPTAELILWQIAVVGGDPTGRSTCNAEGVQALSEVLMETYPPDHSVVLYRAATLPTLPPTIERLPLRVLADGDIDHASTLYVPPLGVPRKRERLNRRTLVAA
jgi:uncharacterized protein YabN with tetrapyrrole methylase and pyrophosphatase domain